MIEILFTVKSTIADGVQIFNQIFLRYTQLRLSECAQIWCSGALRLTRCCISVEFVGSALCLVTNGATSGGLLVSEMT